MANLYTLLKSTLVEKPTYIGTVAAIHANQTSTVSLFEGGSLTVRGASFPVGRNVLVVGDAIDSEIPNLTVLPKVYV